MPKAYSENALIEQPAIGLFAGLSWQTANAFHETFGAGGTLGREHAGDVVLTSHLVLALKKLNPLATTEAIDAAVYELTRDRNVMSLGGANRDVYGLLKNGVRVEIRTPTGDPIPDRIGTEIPRRKIQHQLKLVLTPEEIGRTGERRHMVYLWTKVS